MVLNYPRVANYTSDPSATGTGGGDLIVDNYGKRYRVVNYAPLDSTGERCYILHPDGTIR